MQLDTHEHFSKSRNFAESDKTISSSVVKMKSVLQVTVTLIWKKNNCFTLYPQSQTYQAFRTWHSARE